MVQHRFTTVYLLGRRSGVTPGTNSLLPRSIEKVSIGCAVCFQPQCFEDSHSENSRNFAHFGQRAPTFSANWFPSGGGTIHLTRWLKIGLCVAFVYDKVVAFVRRTPEHNASRSPINSGNLQMKTLCYEDLDSSTAKDLVTSRQTFEVTGLSGRMSSAVHKVENIIESSGLKCRVYTVGRVAAAGGSLFGGITGVLGVASAVGMAAHNVATFNPDYEIGKHRIDNKLTVKYKK